MRTRACRGLWVIPKVHCADLWEGQRSLVGETSAVSTNRPRRTVPHRTCRRTAEPQVRVAVLPWHVMRPEAS